MGSSGPRACEADAPFPATCLLNDDRCLISGPSEDHVCTHDPWSGAMPCFRTLDPDGGDQCKVMTLGRGAKPGSISYHDSKDQGRIQAAAQT